MVKDAVPSNVREFPSFLNCNLQISLFFPLFLKIVESRKREEMKEKLVHLAAGISHFELFFLLKFDYGINRGGKLLKSLRPLPLPPPFLPFFSFPGKVTPAVYGHIDIAFSFT